jgi:hypothetical protein
MSDIAMELYAMDSGLLRAEKSIESAGEGQSKLKIAMVRLYVDEAVPRIAASVRQVIGSMESGEALLAMADILSRLTDLTPANTALLKRDIADEIIEVGRYTC